MGMGLRRRGGRRRGVGFGRRRKRIGLGRRRRRRGRRGGGAVLLLTCCFGGMKDPYARNQKDILAMQQYQQQILAQLQQQQMQQQLQQQQMQEQQQVHHLTAPGLDWPSSGFGPNYVNEDAAELQRSQHELLNDILAQQAEEKDPEKLEELFRQQNEVIQQMQQMQSAGFQYTDGIPTAQRPGDPAAPAAAPSAPPAAAMY